ncbi:ribonuclease D [Algihabitans sp.]|uniref:ribonuclease D n=1 Tax=Algihabitans sp. TaxID=2821514 RepID=UPI003BA8870E
MTLITDPQDAAAFCARQAEADFITVDTEFIRDTTYWPRLCLIQIAGPEEAAAIDPLAEGMDLEPLWSLFDKTDLLKVFHAARQDLEIFFHDSGRLPHPVFDTQVAAMVCGFGDQVGYEKLANRLAGARIDKSVRFADWAHRPLGRKQLDYALADVTHLRVIYQKLRRKLAKSERESWLEEEMAVLLNPATYRLEPDEAWRRLKSRSRDRRYLAHLRNLAAWREREAQRRNVPRNRILRDEQIYDIAGLSPQTAEDLARARGVSADYARGKVGQAILEAVAEGLATDEADLPKLPPREQPLEAGPVVDLLKVLLKLQCEQHGVAQRLVASSADLDALAAGDPDKERDLLQGWRGEIFGKAATALLKGQLLLTGDGSGGLQVTDRK